jgi:hypothetical protein
VTDDSSIASATYQQESRQTAGRAMTDVNEEETVSGGET